MQLTQTDVFLKSIILRTAHLSGQSYFDEMVLALEEATEADFTFIGKATGFNSVETVAICSKGQAVDPFSYPLSGSPCEGVLENGFCIYPDNVYRLFPEDQLLDDMGIKGYIGKSLMDQDNQVIGLVVSLFKRPIEVRNASAELFEVLALGIGKELELELTSAALLDSKRGYKNLTEDLPLVVYKCLSDDGQRMLYLNSYIETLTGYAKGEFLEGRISLKNLIHPDDLSMVGSASSFDQVNYFHITYRLGHRNGAWKYVEEKGRLSDHQAVDGVKVFEGYILDVTDRVTKEQSLLKINKELDNFVYKVSHDLRAPIATSLGLIALIKAEVGLVENVEYPYISLLDKSLNKLDSYIQDVLDYARNARTELSIEKIDLKAFVLDCRDDQSRQNSDFSLQCDDELTVNTDPVRLRAVIGNLLSNAFKFVRFQRAGKHMVKVVVSATESGVMIVVEDNGEGIREEYKDKIFGMFFRATESAPGSGLGLYIVKESVASIHGHIEMESTYGLGTKFTLRIPNLTTLGD